MTTAFILAWDAKCSDCGGTMKAGSPAQYCDTTGLALKHINNGCQSPEQVIYRALDSHQWINTQSLCTCGWNPDRIKFPDHVAHQAQMVRAALRLP